MTEEKRFQVRDATGPGWEWLPDWCVVDTKRQVRVAVYDDEASARSHCDELNGAEPTGYLEQALSAAMTRIVDCGWSDREEEQRVREQVRLAIYDAAPFIAEHHRAAAREENDEFNGKLQSGYSFCHPDSNCKAMSRYFALCAEIEAEISRLNIEAGDPQLNEFAQQQAQHDANCLSDLLATQQGGDRG